jgi:hypothetical protein
MISKRIFNIWLALGLLLNLLQFADASSTLSRWIGPSWLWLIVLPLCCIGLLQSFRWSLALWAARGDFWRTATRAVSGYSRPVPQAIRIRKAVT